MSDQQDAEAAASQLAQAIARMAATPPDGSGFTGLPDMELIVVLRGSSMDGQYLWTWDWFSRPKTNKPDVADGR